MNAAERALHDFLAQPTTGTLWALRAALEAGGDVPPAAAVWGHADACFRFLNSLQSRATARQFSHFASLLDMGAVGGVALQNLLESRPTGDWWLRFGLAGLGEGLMVLAARQYVKAWDEELRAEFADAAWYLSGAFGDLSRQLRPALPPEQRAALIESLVGPVRQAERPTVARAALAIRLFQLLLLLSIVQPNAEA